MRHSLGAPGLEFRLPNRDIRCVVSRGSIFLPTLFSARKQFRFKLGDILYHLKIINHHDI